MKYNFIITVNFQNNRGEISGNNEFFAVSCAKYKSIMIGENKKNPCYVTRLNVMGAFYAFLNSTIVFPEGNLPWKRLVALTIDTKFLVGKRLIITVSVLCNRICCQSC